MKMRIDFFFPIVLGLFLLIAQPIAAGVYGDELGKCLVRSTTDTDKSHLVRWRFATIAAHPEVRSMASITVEERDELSAGAATIFRNLLIDACGSEAKEAVQHEGQATIEAALSVLGSVATHGLMAHPDVTAFLSTLEEHLDQEKLNKDLGLN
jgi:hypothetical protein